MHLAGQLNDQFEKRGIPFVATQDTECAVVKLPNGNSVDILVDNINELNATFDVMNIIHEHNPELLNSCNYFDDKILKIEKQLTYDSNINYTVGCWLDFHVRLDNHPSIYSSVQHETSKPLVQNRISNHVDTLFDNQTELSDFAHVDVIFDNENKLNTSYDYFKSKLIFMLDNLKHASDEQKSELESLDIKMNHISNHTESEPINIDEIHQKLNENAPYTGSTKLDEIYRQLDESQLPFYCHIEHSDNPKFVLYSESDQILARYEIVDGYVSNQFVSDLDFLNHLNDAEPYLIGCIHSIRDNGTVTVHHNDSIVYINSNVDDTITLTSVTYNHLSESITEPYGYDWLRSTVNITSSSKITMSNILEGIDNLISTNIEVSNESVSLVEDSISKLFLKQPVMARASSEDKTELVLSEEDLQVVLDDNILSEEDLQTSQINNHLEF